MPDGFMGDPEVKRVFWARKRREAKLVALCWAASVLLFNGVYWLANAVDPQRFQVEVRGEGGRDIIFFCQGGDIQIFMNFLAVTSRPVTMVVKCPVKGGEWEVEVPKDVFDAGLDAPGCVASFEWKGRRYTVPDGRWDWVRKGRFERELTVDWPQLLLHKYFEGMGVLLLACLPLGLLFLMVCGIANVNWTAAEVEVEVAMARSAKRKKKGGRGK